MCPKTPRHEHTSLEAETLLQLVEEVSPLDISREELTPLETKRGGRRVPDPSPPGTAASFSCFIYLPCCCPACSWQTNPGTSGAAKTIQY